MKRYKLKKDLPTFEAGMVAELNNDGDLILVGAAVPGTPFVKGYVIYRDHELKSCPNILKDWFEEIPEKPKTVWDLKEGDRYYSISSDGFITAETYHLWTQYEDDMRRKIGNAFLTQDEAEKELARCKAKQILLRDTKGFKPDWQDITQAKYEVYYDFEEKEFNTVNACSCAEKPDLWFETTKDAEGSIKAHEKEWLIYLGVKK